MKDYKYSFGLTLFIVYLNFIFIFQGVKVKAFTLDTSLQKNYDEDSPIEIVIISKKTHPFYAIPAFGQKLILELKRNQHLTSSGFTTTVYDGNKRERLNSNIDCHYLHTSESMTASIDLCKSDKLYGFIFLDYAVFEIMPLDDGILTSQGFPHVIKLINLTYNAWKEAAIGKIIKNQENLLFKGPHVKLNGKRGLGKRPNVEVGLFLDEVAYKLFSTYLKGDNTQLKDMLLAYMNGVQALYHHPSAGIKLDIVLTNMEIQKKQPSDLPNYSGERTGLLDSFCAFNEKHNPPKDNDPKHWDIGVYLSGLDFYSIDYGRMNNVTMGLSAVGGVCSSKYSCLIAELGTTNVLGKPYPSAGFTSIYILAHEIGHNLGMHHDSSSNNCPKDGFIMSPSRGVAGETMWSVCSAEVLKKLSATAKCLFEASPKSSSPFNHMKFKEKPGTVWGSKKQCEVLLKDRDAKSRAAEKLEDICGNLQCETKHKNGVFLAGPALDGTTCGKNKWCLGGECVNKG